MRLGTPSASGRAGSATKQPEGGSSATVNPWPGSGSGSESEQLGRAKTMNEEDMHDLVRGVRWRQRQQEQERGSTEVIDTRSTASLVSRPGTGTRPEKM